ncbi:YmfL family putative regulatory protein [Undibacterium aquatile]|uniref:Phage regulatory protein CII n=1 Tax=Undibacterium aquatile TaxID=1537398 RepID=A0ABR6XF33_9BURK|nr:YmfL family putative regulatory protein [Undibacterium aquatile]MBC3811348.1 hypothetical protein [Undibacterium aquatile]
MNLRQAYISMIRAFPGGWDAMCGALGMSRDQLENRIYERRGQELGAETALLMQEFSGTKLFAESVASASSGRFMHLPDLGDIYDEDISLKFHELYAELGALSVQFQAAIKDGKIDKRERENLNAIVDRMHRIMDELRALTFRVYCEETAASVRERKGQQHG